jgi:hypothetical protein
MYGAEKRYNREYEKLIARTLIQKTTRLPVGFSAGVRLYYKDIFKIYDALKSFAYELFYGYHYEYI